MIPDDILDLWYEYDFTASQNKRQRKQEEYVKECKAAFGEQPNLR